MFRNSVDFECGITLAREFCGQNLGRTEVIELEEISRLSPTTESRAEVNGRLLPVLKRATHDDDCQGTSAAKSSNRVRNEKQSQGIGKIDTHQYFL